MTSDVTVVIPVYGPGPHLEEVIASLDRQLPQSCQIIVSHSGEGDPTDRFTDSSRVTVLHSPERLFAGAARNRGMALADTEWVAFVDEDVVPASDWHRALFHSIAHNDCDCILGAVDYRVSGGYWGVSLWYVEFGSVHPYMSRQAILGGASANMVVRREPFVAIGGFPEHRRMAEDSAAQARLASAGQSLLFEPKLVVSHFNLPGVRHMVRHLYSIGRYSADVRREFSELPGASAVRWPLLSIGMLPARLAQTTKRVFAARGAPIGQFVAHLPGILVGLVAWSAGFAREAFQPGSKVSGY